MLWNDIEWPDGGKDSDPESLAALFHRYFEAVPDGVLNDRWGVPHHGFLTREYSHVPEIMEPVWEATRGLGYSFGYNSDEDAGRSMSGAQLIRLLVDVVSKNGNLLINVGPAPTAASPTSSWPRCASSGDGWASTATRSTAPGRGSARASPSGAAGVHDDRSDGARAPARPLRWRTDAAAGADRPRRHLVGRRARRDRRVRAVEVPEGLRGEPVAVLSLR
ncbi:alpha-L-fucosidase [Tessaracoccus coleopterorum]|uniref:alpha-L-fucosidase n=1 Tax=Tessaracoccus coleopterorum TaxID=2714950 RepID=UPI002F9112F0